MIMQTFDRSQYLKTLKERASKRNITQEFQLIGLEVATILHDLPHKALYIKYTKEYGADRILSLAKDVAQRKDIKNLGAYFMSIVENLRKEHKIFKVPK